MAQERMRDLSFYLALDRVTNNHYRYMSLEVKTELIARTPNCLSDSLDERMFWLKNELTAYPACTGCTKILDSSSWYPSTTKENIERGWSPKGYRLFCSRACAANSEHKREAVRLRAQERFGVDHPLSAKEVQDKRKRTNLAKYGSEHPHPWGSSQHQKMLTEKYGVQTARHIPGVHHRTVASIRQKTIEYLPTKIQELEGLFNVQLITPIESLEIQTRMYDLELAWKHSCGHIFTSNISERGIKQCPRCSASSSLAERELGDMLDAKQLTVHRRDRTALGVELDLWLPDHKIGIEYDGSYWHSARFVSKEKCMEKLELAEASGVQLITIQEHLMINKKDLVLSRLMSVIGLNQQKIHGRSTKVAEITVSEANELFASSHLQGGARASVAFGLFSNNELVAAMSFAKPRFSRHLADWELVRYASKPGYTVTGGAGKLLKAFRTSYTGSIMSYADRCWSTGNLYRALGFEFIRNSAPSYYWVSGQYIFSRYQTQKKKLPHLLEMINKPFDIALSESENMITNKFLKVYDRGNSVWLLQ